MNKPMSLGELVELLSHQKKCLEVYIKTADGRVQHLVDVEPDEQAQTVTLWGGDIA